MASSINNKEFTVVGELTDDCQYIKISHHKPLRRIIKRLMGKKLEVGFKELKYQRSSAQNRWLWGVAYVCISAWYKETQGEVISKDAIHAHTLQHILDYKIVAEEVLGREVLVVKGKSTSKLNTKEFSDLVEKLCAYWNERMSFIDEDGNLVGEIPLPKDNNLLSDFIKDK